MSESSEIPEIQVGFSSCPNDTFMFHGLMSGQVEVPGVQLRPAIADIEALNLRALGHTPARPLPVTKLSTNALAHLCEDYTVLSAGAALGRGCGPLVVRRRDDAQLDELAALSGHTIAIPGEFTTAHLLLRSFVGALSVRIMRFDQIMPAVADGRVDAGLIIHESRFTYPEHGLVELADLGVLWEQATGLPIPLGVICAQRRLGPAMIDTLEQGLRRSIELAMAEPDRSRAWIREHAQELDDEVCRKHIELYVNSFSVELGSEGRAAIDELLARGRASGFLPAGPTPWR